MAAINESFGVRKFMAHLGGNWENVKPGTTELVDYKGGRRRNIDLDGDELNMIDLNKEIMEVFGCQDTMDPRAMQLSCVIDHCLFELPTDDSLMDMWKRMMPAADRKFHIFVTLDTNFLNLPKPKKATQPKSVSQHPNSATKSKSKKASQAPTPPRRSVRILSKPPPDFEADMNLEEELQNVHSDTEMETLPDSVVDEVVMTPLPSSANDEVMTPLSTTDEVTPQGSRSAKRIIELLKDVPGVASVLQDCGDLLHMFDQVEASFKEKLGVDVNMLEEDDLDLGSDYDEDDRLGYDPGEGFGPCVKLGADYVSSESESDEGEGIEDEDGEYMPPLEFEHESEDDSELGSGKEDGGPDLVPEKEVMEEEHDEVKKFKELATNIFDNEDEEDKDADPSQLGDLQIVPGMKWSTMKDCRKFFRTYAIQERFQWMQEKNDRKRYILKCANENCMWYVKCSLKNDNHTVQLRKHQNVHVCESSWKDNTVHINAPWVVTKIVETFRVHPEWRPKNIKAEIRRLWAYDISYWTAWAARQKILEIINGNYEESFANVPELCRQILKGNPDSVCRWFVDPETDEFLGLFIAFKASLDGWVAGCRPVVGLDGAFLKGKYAGCCLSAMGMDAMNGLFPLAIYICRGENKASWSMILGLLQQYLWRQKEILTFISDRQKGIIQAVAESYPTADHRYCFRHMYKNFKNYKFKGDHMEMLAWGAAKAYRLTEHERMMEFLEKETKEAREWLEKEPKKLWARCAFPNTSKCDAVTNNFSESFNAWILVCRDKPICKFVDQYTMALLGMIYDRRMASREMEDGGLVPSVMYVINKLMKKFNRYKIEGVSDHVFCAVNNKSKKKFNVDLVAHKCTCNVWDLSGIPCVHAVAVLRPRRESWVKYTSPYFTVEAFRATYAGYIFPIDNEEDWGKLREEERILPPPHTVAPGRPKTLRIKGDDEEPNSNRRCSICKEPNHNARTCKARKLQKDKEEAAALKKQKKNGGAPTQQKRNTRDYAELTIQHTKKKQRHEISCPSTTPTPTPMATSTPTPSTDASTTGGRGSGHRGSSNRGGRRGGGGGRMQYWLGEPGPSSQLE